MKKSDANQKKRAAFSDSCLAETRQKRYVGVRRHLPSETLIEEKRIVVVRIRFESLGSNDLGESPTVENALECKCERWQPHRIRWEARIVDTSSNLPVRGTSLVVVCLVFYRCKTPAAYHNSKWGTRLAVGQIPASQVLCTIVCNLRLVF